MAKILIVDDEDSVRTIMSQIVVSKGHSASVARSVDEAMDILASEEIDLVVSDIRMQPTDGMVLLDRVRSIEPNVPVIMMTAYASVETALDALKIGAYDYLIKPFKVVEFIDVVDKALASAGLQKERGQGSGPIEATYCFGSAIGVSAAMQETARLLGLVSPTDATVLLRGERGTGRRLMAGEVHAKSLRAGQECVRIPCETVGGAPGEPEEGTKRDAGLSVSEFSDRLVDAAGGSVILENVEHLSLPAQKIVLHVLRDKTVPPQEGGEPVHADVRMIVTGGPELRKAVEAGGFDADLYKRFCLLSVEIAPLCERTDDIMPMFWHFLRRDAEAAGEEVPTVSGDARGALQHYVWPGNVQELQEVAAHAYAHMEDGKVVRQSLPQSILSTLSVSEYQGSGVQKGEDRAASLKAFLRRKGVELTDVMLRNGSRSKSVKNP